MEKYYKVIKENFLWEVGAILEPTDDGEEYTSIDAIYDVGEHYEGIGKNVVENCPEYFQRVYKVDLITKSVYKIKEEAKALLDKQFKG